MSKDVKSILLQIVAHLENSGGCSAGPAGPVGPEGPRGPKGTSAPMSIAGGPTATSSTDAE